MASNMSRTLSALRADGYLCEIVEKFNPYVGEHGIRQDFYGFGDLIAIKPGIGIKAIQVCGTDFMPHVRKILIERRENASTWMQSGGLLELWGWRKLKLKRGGKAMRWTPRIKVFTLEDFGVGGMFG